MPPGRPPNIVNQNQSQSQSQSTSSHSGSYLNNTHHSSVYPVDSVVDVADQLGIPNLRPQVASALASDVEYRIRFVAQVSFPAWK